MEIRYYPDPILLAPAVPVDVARLAEPEFQTTLAAMFEAMYEVAGLGLAAPQVGIGERFFVINLDPDGSREGEAVFINPEIVAPAGEQTASEGCLSFPNVRGMVTRAATCTIRALDREGRPLQLEAEGLLARAFQHEVDHLDGKLFVARFSAADLAINQRALNDLKKRYAKTQRRASKPRKQRKNRLRPQRH